MEYDAYLHIVCSIGIENLKHSMCSWHALFLIVLIAHAGDHPWSLLRRTSNP